LVVFFINDHDNPGGASVVHQQCRQPETVSRKEDVVMVAEIIGPDLLIVFGVLVLLFGGSQLPKLARSIGRAKTEFRHGLADKGPAEDKTSTEVEAPKSNVPQKPSTN
jgi:sec-independent protein translocase protein TatA